MRTYQRTADDVTRSNMRAQMAFGSMGASASLFLRVLGPLSAGITVVGAAMRVFHNIRSVQEGTLSMAAQLSQVLEFDADPSRNYMENLKLSKSFMKDLVSDAAKLPGEVVDFQRAAGMSSFSVLAGGGDMQMLRRMVGNLSITALAAGQSMGDASSQMYRILSGQASVGDNPMFAFLKPMLGEGNFNELDLSERVKRLDEVLERFAGNPAFRSEAINQFSTQWSTLMENLFGASSVLGELGKDPFGSLIASLTNLNTWLTDHKDSLSWWGNEGAGFFSAITESRHWQGAKMVFNGIGRASESIREGVQDRRIIRESSEAALKRMGVTDYFDLTKDQRTQIAKIRREEEQRLRHVAALPPVGSGVLLTATQMADRAKKKTPALTGDTVTNYVTIKVDLKSDDSPEAVAVKMGKAFDRMTRHPTRAARAASITPRARTIN